MGVKMHSCDISTWGIGIGGPLSPLASLQVRGQYGLH